MIKYRCRWIGDVMEDNTIKETIEEVSKSMADNGYDAVTQIVGYIISNDLGYIPEFDDNRNKIAKLDRTAIVEDILRDYLK